jgi:hypothetical protein
LNALVLFVGSRRASRHKLTFILFFTHPEFFLGLGFMDVSSPLNIDLSICG